MSLYAQRGRLPAAVGRNSTSVSSGASTVVRRSGGLGTGRRHRRVLEEFVDTQRAEHQGFLLLSVSFSDRRRGRRPAPNARRKDGGRGVGIVSGAESLHTPAGPAASRANVLGSVGQWERSGDSRAGAIQAKRRSAIATGGTAPSGFMFVDGRRVVSDQEQFVLADMQQHRRAGLSWAGRADLQLCTTGRRTRTGGHWTRQGVHLVMRARERAKRPPRSVLPRAECAHQIQIRGDQRVSVPDRWMFPQ